jgi:prevent-host-death family protein
VVRRSTCGGSPLRTVTAREANQAFSRILGEAEGGEEIVITRRGRPVAVLRPWKQPMTPERQAAIERISRLMREGVSLGGGPYYTSRDELYDGEREPEPAT